MKFKKDRDGVHTPLRLYGLYEFSNDNPVEKFEQFSAHTKKHIDNVTKIGHYLINELKNNIEKNPNLKKDYKIPENGNIDNLMNNFDELINAHDIAKTSNDPAFLKKYKFERPMMETLSKYAGINFDEKGRKENISIANALTVVDKKEMDDLTKKLGLNEWETELFAQIENMADLVDRGCNPISSVEMAKKTSLASAFGQFAQPSAWQNLILSAEKHYDQNMLKGQLRFATKLLNNVNEPKVSNKASKKIISYAPDLNDLKELKLQSNDSVLNDTGCSYRNKFLKEVREASNVESPIKKGEDITSALSYKKIG